MCSGHYLAFAIGTSPIIHLVRRIKLYITFVFNFLWVLQPSQEKLKTIELERLSFTFVLDGKREFVPRDRPSLSFTFYYFYSKISSFAPVLSMRIELDSFCLLIFCFKKYSTWIWRLQFAVNVTCNLSIKLIQKVGGQTRCILGNVEVANDGFLTCPIIQTVEGANKLK